MGGVMGGVTVAQARSGAELREWIRFPRLHVYPDSGPWVPPLDGDLRRMLDRRNNPFFQHGEAQPYLARDASGRVVGRVLASIYHRHNVRHGERAAFFGYFECIDDTQVARALVDAAAAYGAERGCTLLRGPFNMTAMQEMGILVEGFAAAPAVDETYTAQYYPALLEGAGLRAVFPVTTFRLDGLEAINPDALLGERHRALLANGRMRIRAANLREFRREIETLRELLNDSFYENPHFVPITHDEFFFQIGPYRRLMDSEISLVAELDGVPCGFVVTVPDYNLLLKRMNGTLGPSALLTFLRGRSQIRDAVLIIMGVELQLQGQGVMRVLQAELLRALRRKGYRRLTITWVADVNAKSLGTMHALGARPLHQLTLYERPIGGGADADGEAGTA
jgi:GNAT superfamily N-acetyltransferase